MLVYHCFVNNDFVFCIGDLMFWQRADTPPEISGLVVYFHFECVVVSRSIVGPMYLTSVYTGTTSPFTPIGWHTVLLVVNIICIDLLRLGLILHCFIQSSKMHRCWPDLYERTEWSIIVI